MRKVLMKGFTGQYSEHPLIAAYQNDRELLHLVVDAAKLQSLTTAAYLRSPLCFCPVFWPHALVVGMPCTHLFCTLPKIAKSAEAHKLILREKSLLYQVDKYPQITPGPQICCAALASMGNYAGGFVDVIPLQDIESVTVEVVAGIEPWLL